jgi:Fe-S cluster assembly protein SufD
MIAEKSHTAQQLIEKLSVSGSKVSFMPQNLVGRALVWLEEKGIPTAKHEEYRFCNIDAILKKDFRKLDGTLKPVDSVNQWRIDGATNIVLVNGVLSHELSDKPGENGIVISDLTRIDKSGRERIGTTAAPDSDAFVAMNTAYATPGLYIHVSEGIKVSNPVNVIAVSSAEGETVVNPRMLVVLDDHAAVTVILRQVSAGEGKVFSNMLFEGFAAPHAHLQTITVQQEGAGGYSVNTHQIRVAEKATYDNTTVTLSGQLVRNNHNVYLDGTFASAHLYGLFSINGSQLIDNHTVVDHRVPDCVSNELYKGIADGKSTGVFNGKIFVQRHAQKTNAYQSSKNILLSDDATIYAKPQLEIYANDVKCSHGTSTGRIDENAVFYLKSRGIGADTARRILLASFAGEVTGRIGIEALKTQVESFFDKELSA